MDWLEEVTTSAFNIYQLLFTPDIQKGQADVILANSEFTARVFRSYFPSIPRNPEVVYPGINIQAYVSEVDTTDPEISKILSFVLFLVLYTPD